MLSTSAILAIQLVSAAPITFPDTASSSYVLVEAQKCNVARDKSCFQRVLTPYFKQKHNLEIQDFNLEWCFGDVHHPADTQGCQVWAQVSKGVTFSVNFLLGFPEQETAIVKFMRQAMTLKARYGIINAASFTSKGMRMFFLRSYDFPDEIAVDSEMRILPGITHEYVYRWTELRPVLLHDIFRKLHMACSPLAMNLQYNYSGDGGEPIERALFIIGLGELAGGWMFSPNPEHRHYAGMSGICHWDD